MLQRQHPAVYASFDRFPGPKGAAIHIQHMVTTLVELVGGALVYGLGDAVLPAYQHHDATEVVRFDQPTPHLLDRIQAYGRLLSHLLASQHHLRIGHFRDPWSGIPLLQHAQGRYPLIYEINGLPSIELPEHYPHVPPQTITKLRRFEIDCWSHATRIITPSQTMRQRLISLGAPAQHICVIPNGADLPTSVSAPPAGAPQQYGLYFGALQSWQGIDILLRAWQQLRDLPTLQLVICSSVTERRARPYMRLANQLQLHDRIHWHFQLDTATLQSWKQHALFTLAPLTECPRNLEQGCCPLKVLESMAVGVPVIASDLPAIREIITHAQNGWLVRPDRPAELARAIRILVEYPQQRQALGAAAQHTIAASWTWQRSQQALRDLYHAVLGA